MEVALILDQPLSKRQCAVNNCAVSLDQLPDHISLCTKHQIELNLFAQDIRRWNDGRSLPIDDVLFIYLHPDPIGCCAKTLAKHLGCHESTFQKYAKRGEIKAIRYLGPQTYTWKIFQDEQIRVIDLERNWVKYYVVGRANKIRNQGFKKLILAGKFGPYTYSLSGDLMITREIAETDISGRFTRLKAKEKSEGYKSRKKARRLYLKRGEKTLNWVATQCGVFKQTGYQWKRTGKIRCKRRGNWWVVNSRDYRTFLEDMANRRYSGLREKVVQRCQLLLEELDQNKTRCK